MGDLRGKVRAGAQAALLGAALLLAWPAPAPAQMQELKPTTAADAYFERGERALRRGDLPGAIEFLAVAARMAPDDPKILSAYAQALIQAGRQKEAAQILRGARGTRSVNEDLALGVVQYALKDWSAAADHLRRAVERSPDNGAAHLFLASALIETGALDEAHSHLEKARSLDPWLAADVELRLGRIALARNDKATAEEHFREAERLTPRSTLGEIARKSAGAPSRRWNAYTTAGVAWDSNVNLAGEDELLSASGEDDVRGFFELGADYDLYRSDLFNLRAGATAFISRHVEERDFDLLTTQAWTVAALRLREDLTLDARYTFEYIWVDFGQFRLTHAVEPSLRWRPRPDLLTRVLFRYEDRDFFTTQGMFPTFALPPPFDKTTGNDPLNRDGQLRIPGIEQYWFFPDLTGWGRGFLRAGYRYREETTTGTESDSTGHVANLMLGQPLPWQLYGLLEGEYERRNFSNVSVIGLLSRDTFSDRQDDIWTAQALLRRPITEHLTAELGYRFTKWGSNVDFYEFTRHIVHFLVTYRY